MKLSFSVAALLLAAVVEACSSSSVGSGDTRELPTASCGGAKATLTPAGDTYDDSRPSRGSEPISVTMFVYRADDAPIASGMDASADADADASADAGAWRPDPNLSCQSDRLLARTEGPLELEPGTYYVCNSPGGCACLKLRLTGGPAEFYFSAGPGGGNRTVSGCAEVVRP